MFAYRAMVLDDVLGWSLSVGSSSSSSGGSSSSSSSSS